MRSMVMPMGQGWRPEARIGVDLDFAVGHWVGAWGGGGGLYDSDGDVAFGEEGFDLGDGVGAEVEDGGGERGVGMAGGEDPGRRVRGDQRRRRATTGIWTASETAAVISRS